MNDETVLWRGSPSQWLNLGPYLIALLLAAGIVAGGIFFAPAFVGLVLPVLFAVWNYLCVKTRVYELTSERLKITSGVINQHVDEIELYRIKDSQLVRTWWMRLTGLASIKLETSDRTLPNLVIPAIFGGGDMRELLRRQVEIQRDSKRVREMDFDSGEDEAAGLN